MSETEKAGYDPFHKGELYYEALKHFDEDTARELSFMEDLPDDKPPEIEKPPKGYK